MSLLLEGEDSLTKQRRRRTFFVSRNTETGRARTVCGGGHLGDTCSNLGEGSEERRQVKELKDRKRRNENYFKRRTTGLHSF